MNRFVWTLSGATGSGKSFLWKQLTSLFPRPVFALDRVADLGNVGLSFDHAEHLRQYLIAAIRGNVEGSQNGVYVIDGGAGASGPVGCTIDSGRALLELVWRTKMSCTIVLDEAHNWASEQEFNPHLDQILREGRHHGISVVACTRRPQQLGKVLIGESLLSVFEHHDQPAQRRAAKALGRGVDPEDLARMEPEQYRIGGRTAMIGETMQKKLAPEGADPNKVYRWDPASAHARREENMPRQA
jgi:hypothetical protein